MVRRRQEDLRPVQQLTPKATPVQQFFGFNPPAPVSAIAIDFASVSRSLAGIAKSGKQRRFKQQEKGATAAEEFFASTEGTGVPENQSYEAWKIFATEQGLSEAASVAGQKRLSRLQGRQIASGVTAALTAKVATAIQAGEEDLDLGKFQREVFEEQDIDLSKLDSLQMEGFAGPYNETLINQEGVIRASVVQRETQQIHNGAREDLQETLGQVDVTADEIQETYDLLATQEIGAILPKNRKNIIVDALVQEAGSNPDPNDYLRALRAAMTIDSGGGTLLGEDNSPYRTTEGRQSGTIAARLGQLEKDAVARSLTFAREEEGRATAARSIIKSSTEGWYESIDQLTLSAVTDVEFEGLRDQMQVAIQHSSQGNSDLGENGAARLLSEWTSVAVAARRARLSSVNSRNSEQRRAQESDSFKNADRLIYDVRTNALSIEEAGANLQASLIIGDEAYAGQASRIIREFQSLQTAGSMFKNTEAAPVLEEFRDTKFMAGLNVSTGRTLQAKHRAVLNGLQESFDSVTESLAYTSATSQDTRDGLIQNWRTSEEVTQFREILESIQNDSREQISTMTEELQNAVRFGDLRVLKEIESDPDQDPERQARARDAQFSLQESIVPRNMPTFQMTQRQLVAILAPEGELAEEVAAGGDLTKAMNVKLLGASAQLEATIAIEMATLMEANSLKSEPLSLQDMQRQANALALDIVVKEREELGNGTSVSIEQEFGAESVTPVMDARATASTTNQLRDLAIQRGVLGVEAYFPATTLDTAAGVKKLKALGKDYFSSLDDYYRMDLETSPEDRREVLESLETQTRTTINEIIETREDGELSEANQQRLLFILQSTPNVASLTDIGDTGHMVFRTEASKESIAEGRREVTRLKAAEATSLMRRKLNRQRRPGGGTFTGTLRNIAGDFGVNRFGTDYSEIRSDREDAEEHLEELVRLEEGDAKLKIDITEAVVQSKINPYTVPWAGSFEILQKYRDDQPENFKAFMDVLQIPENDYDNFMDQQRKVYR